MKKTLGILILLFLAHAPARADLDALIKQNVDRAVSSYDKTLAETDKQKVTARLWIHVRSQEQADEVRQILPWLSSIKLNGQKIEVKPVTVVTEGPGSSDIRFFKAADKTDAALLKRELDKVVPQLRINDKSAAYKRTTWLTAGHYELWLSPTTRLHAPPN